MSELTRILLGVLCVWRITHLFQAEDGPWDVIVHIRRALGDGFLGRLLDCFYCLSLWVSLPLSWAIGKTLGERALLWPALSAGAILLERATLERERVATQGSSQLPDAYVEDTSVEDEEKRQ